MRGWLLASVMGAAATVGAAEVSFSGKTATTITASAPLEFVSLAPSVGFMTTGSAAEEKTFLSPNINIQKTGTEGYWTVTFRATAATVFSALTLDVGIFNSEGNPQGNDAPRTATFEATAGGATASVTHICRGADPLADQNNRVTLDFGRVVALGVGETLTVTCRRAEETLGCYFGLRSLSWEEVEVPVVGAEGLTWPVDTEELTVVFDGGTLTVPSGRGGLWHGNDRDCVRRDAVGRGHGRAVGAGLRHSSGGRGAGGKQGRVADGWAALLPRDGGVGRAPGRGHGGRHVDA